MEVNRKQSPTWSCLIFTHLAGHQNFDNLYVKVQTGFTTVDGNKNKNQTKETRYLLIMFSWLVYCWLNLMVIQA